MASKTVFFDALAWGFVGFTALLVMGVLWLWWEQSRDVARDVARQKDTAENFKLRHRRPS